MSEIEKTLVIIKPDAVQRGLIGTIIQRFEARGLKIIAMKYGFASKEQIEEHYPDLKDKEYFTKFTNYITQRGPIVTIIFEGNNATKIGRQMVGLNDPVIADIGSIRGDFCIEKPRKAIGASDNLENAEREIKIWFKESEIFSWTKVDEGMIKEVVAKN